MPAITAYFDEHALALYVQRDQRGPLMVVPAVGHTSERFTLPEQAVELQHPDDAVETVLDLIADVPMPKKIREQIAERLGVDIEDVGTSNSRRVA